jgi:uncharacterized protein (DUF58 family)
LPISSPQSQSPLKNTALHRIITTRGYPVVFHWIVQIILLGLLIFSAFKQMIPLLVGAVFMLLLGILPRLWSWHALHNVTGRMALGHNRAFPGEEVELILELANRGLSLFWLDIELEIPYRLITGKTPSSPYTWKHLRWGTTLSRGQVITWKHTLEAGARGNYQLGPLRLSSADPFGFFPRELVLPDSQNLLVYPRIVPLSKLDLPLRGLLGEKAVPVGIYEDITRVAGARDYRYGDAFRRIHWKASAARGELQTRQCESSTSLNLLIIFDVHSFPREDDVFEHAVSTVASLAYEAERQGFAVALISNSIPAVKIPTASGRNHLLQILEALARITINSQLSIFQQIDNFRTIIPMGATLVMITRASTPAISSLATRFKQDGHSFICIEVDQAQSQAGPADISPIEGAR